MSLTGLTSKRRQGCVPFWRPYGTISFPTFPGSGGCPHSFLLMDSFSIFKASNYRLNRSHSALLCPPFLPLSSTFKDLSDYIGPTQMIQGNLLILRSANQQLAFHLPFQFPFCHVLYHTHICQALGYGCLEGWGVALFFLSVRKGTDLREW